MTVVKRIPEPVNYMPTILLELLVLLMIISVIVYVVYLIVSIKKKLNAVNDKIDILLSDKKKE
ncbi:MAG: hypothetical protein FH756_01155 [Firmicutes bacterium]|nr:hypothetical protein [Bacillota bacterium]